MKIETARKRLEIQGFFGLTDEEVTQFNYWLRLSPAICLIWIGVGVYFASPWILGMLVPFEFLGGMSKGHPFDMLFNYGIRHVLGLPELPDYGVPRRFAFVMGSVMTGVTATLFALGANTAAYVIGGLMMSVASIQVTTGLCGPAVIFGLLFGPVVYKIEQGKGA
jgi:hypothetical protein